MLNLLKKLAAPLFESAKKNVIAEIDRAVLKLENGEAVNLVVNALKKVLLDLLGKSHLPGVASVLLDFVLASVDWNLLAASPKEKAVRELKQIRLKVAGARL